MAQSPENVATNFLDSYESSEQAIMTSFKSAAFAVTQLYKDSLKQNKKAYAAGYEQCLQDLYQLITSHHAVTSISPNIEQAVIPADELLHFARTKHAQLRSEFGKNIDDASVSGLASSMAAQSHRPQHASQGIHQQHQHSKSHPIFGQSSPYQATPSPPQSFQFTPAQEQQTHQAPTQQDPATSSMFGGPIQFSFDINPPPHSASHNSQPNTPSHDSNISESTESSLKRRFQPSTDFSSLGRPMSMDYEPPVKRGRSKKSEEQ